MNKVIILLTGLIFFISLFSINNINANEDRIINEFIFDDGNTEYITCFDILDNDTIIQGGHKRYGSDWRPFLRYINETGAVFWYNEYNGETGVEEEYIYNVKYHDNYFYAVGSTNGDAMLLKVDIGGTQIYKSRNDDFGDHTFYNWNCYWGLLIQDEYIYCSGYAVEPSYIDVVIANYSYDGTLNDHENYNFNGNSYNYIYDLKEYNDDHFLLVGRTVGTYYENFMVRILKSDFNVYNNYDVNSIGENQYINRYDVNETGTIFLSGYTINPDPSYSWNYTTWAYDMNATCTNGSDWDLTWEKRYGSGICYDIMFDDSKNQSVVTSVGYNDITIWNDKILIKQYASNGTLIYGWSDVTNGSLSSTNYNIELNNNNNYTAVGWGSNGSNQYGEMTIYNNINITEIIENGDQPEIINILPEDNQIYENEIGLIMQGSNLTHIIITINSTEINETEIYNQTALIGYNFGSLNISSYEDGNYTLKFRAYNQITNLSSNYTYTNITKFIPPEIEAPPPIPSTTYEDLTWYEKVMLFIYENFMYFLIISVLALVLVVWTTKH